MTLRWMTLAVCAVLVWSCGNSTAKDGGINTPSPTNLSAAIDSTTAPVAMPIDTPRNYFLSMYNLPYKLTILPDTNIKEKAATVLLMQQNDTVFHQHITMDSIIAHYPDTLFQKSHGDPTLFRRDQQLMAISHAFVRSDRLYLGADFLNSRTGDTSGMPLTFRYRSTRPGEWWAGMY